jgi:hypothetical protein
VVAVVTEARIGPWSPHRAPTMIAALALVSAIVGVIDVVHVERLAVPSCPPGCTSPEAVTLGASPAAPVPQVPAPDEPATRVAAPSLISIPSLGIAAPVDAVGLLSGGGLAVPEDAARVGWFAPEGFALAPGDAGSAVLAGHRDSRRTGPGALHGLEDIEPGTHIVVQHADGRRSHWEVERMQLTLRHALPVDELFTRSGPPRLVLVTCGGAFDAELRRYSHNVIVHALPVAMPVVVAD